MKEILRKAIVGGSIIDGTGAALMPESVVLIEGKRIHSVGKQGKVQVPSDAQLIDAAGKVVMPGLIDAHVHLEGEPPRTGYARRFSAGQRADCLSAVRAVRDIRTLIEEGFTGVRDAESLAAPILKEAINEGSIKGPRIHAAYRAICQTGGHMDRHEISLDIIDKIPSGHGILADGVEECRKAVRVVLREGADWVKIAAGGGIASWRDPLESSQFSMDELNAIMDEAHGWGKKVGAHCYCAKGIKRAVAAGLDVVDHGHLADDEALRMMKEKGVWLVPTMKVVEDIINQKDKWPEYSVEKAKSMYPTVFDTVRKAYTMGVKIASGTDSYIGKHAYELELYVHKVGLTPLETITLATKNGAEVMELGKETGTLEAGKYADLIVVDGNPLEDIRILQDKSKIKCVMKGGEILTDRTA
jgi:imidazolonepropionase-like amidohydrolase